MTTTRPDSNTLQAEGDLEVHDAEQEKGTDVAMTKEERVDRILKRGTPEARRGEPPSLGSASRRPSSARARDRGRPGQGRAGRRRRGRRARARVPGRRLLPRHDAPEPPAGASQPLSASGPPGTFPVKPAGSA